MKKCLLGIWLSIMGVTALGAVNSIDIPLDMNTIKYMPTDSPTGSTPDPTDPNQFHATLTGNILTIETQKDAVSFVVICETSSEQQDKDYFYGLSYGTISIPIVRMGMYYITIGYWNTDFIGQIYVKSISIFDFNGHLLTSDVNHLPSIISGGYIISLQTSYGVTSIKTIMQP